jgi:glutamate-1-semialdehyde 2,1-aminomutase
MDGDMTEKKMITSESQRLFDLAAGIMPGGVNSPVRAFKSVGGTPRIISRGEGAYLYDVDGNRYIDFCCSWGPLILGHTDPDIVAAVQAQIEKGMTFGASTELEYQLADFIVQHVKAVEKIRFVSSGTEAVMSAIRVARGFTGRDLILKFEGCYHGHADHLLVKAGSGLVTFGQPSSAGVPKEFTQHTAVLPLDDESALSDFFSRNGDRLAAVIIEGVPANNGLLIQRQEYMNLLRGLTEKHGALLILDEVITGFRLGFGGAATHYGIAPDLLTFGKVIGGGMPVGAFGGRADVMSVLSPDGPVYQAGTLSGNPVAMVAGLATLQKLERERLFGPLEENTQAFCLELNNRLRNYGCQVIHIGSIFWLVFQADVPRAAHQVSSNGVARFNRLHRDILDAGVYLPPSGYEVCFVSVAHTPKLLKEAADVIVNKVARSQ